MQNNIYIDTNIVIDICDDKRVLHEGSFSLLRHYLEQDRSELFINSDTLSTLFYILSNHSTLNSKEILNKMHFVNEIFTLVSIESDDVAEALNLCDNDSLAYSDYEDAIQYRCAKKIGADVIVTNDKAFVSVDIEVLGTSE